MITSRIIFSLGNVVLKASCPRCPLMVLLVVLTLWGICNWKGIWKELGWFSTIANVYNTRQPWVAMFTIFFIVELTIAICDMQFEDVDSQMLMWNALIRVMKEHGVQNVNLKKFMVDCVLEPISTQLEPCLEVVTQSFQWRIKSGHVFIIGPNFLIDIRRN
jgi:hypothetical protein